MQAGHELREGPAVVDGHEGVADLFVSLIEVGGNDELHNSPVAVVFNAIWPRAGLIYTLHIQTSSVVACTETASIAGGFSCCRNRSIWGTSPTVYDHRRGTEEEGKS